MAMAVIAGLISSTIRLLTLRLMLMPVVCKVIDDFGVWITPKVARFSIPRGPADGAAAKA